MEEHLISFETAKIAKEKGFNLINSWFYCERYGLCEEGEEILYVRNPPNGNYTNQIIFDVNQEFDEGERFYVVSQSLLQKWLWENHRIWVEVTLWGDGIGFTCMLKRVGGKKDDGSTIVYADGMVDTPGNDPYKMLERGLQKALKTIKNEI